VTIARRTAALALAVALSASAGCTDEPSIEAFCDAVDAVQTAGPLFPDRTDGEPVAEPDALAALRSMAAAAPSDIAAQAEVLLAEAEGLATEAAQRSEAIDSSASTTAGPDDAPSAPRPERAAVETAQNEVATFASDECAIDLST